MKPDNPARPLWPRLLVVGFCVHLLFGAQRLFTKSIPVRADEIAAYRRDRVFFHLAAGVDPAAPKNDEQRRRLANARAVARVLAASDEDAVVLYRGEHRGAMELAVGLLAPRILYAESAAPKDVMKIHGRSLASERDGSITRALVLVGVDRETLRVELR